MKRLENDSYSLVTISLLEFIAFIVHGVISLCEEDNDAHKTKKMNGKN